MNHHLTLNNESVTFHAGGYVWIQPLLSDGFWFTGFPHELVNIMVAHPELDINNTLIRVRDRKPFTYISPSTEGY